MASATSALCNLFLLSLISRFFTKNPHHGDLSVFLVALLAGCVAALIAQVLLDRLAENVALTVRLKICEQVMAAPLSAVEFMSTAMLYSTLTTDTFVLANFLKALPLLLSSGITVIGGIVFLIFTDVGTSVWVLCFLVGGVAGHMYLATRLKRHFAQTYECNDFFFAKMKEVIDGIKELKLNQQRRDRFTVHELEPAGARSVHTQLQTLRLLAVSNQWGRFTVFSLIAAISVGPIWSTSHPSNALATFTVVIMYLIDPINQILAHVPEIARIKISLKRITSINRITDAEPLEQSISESDAVSKYLDTIELREVEFHYLNDDGRAFNIGPLNFSLTPGEVVFITGGNGAGKSTFLKLVTGLYIPTAGQIIASGRSVSTYGERDAYRQKFSAIFSDFHLFRDTLMEDSQEVRESASHWLRQLGLAHTVQLTGTHFNTTKLSQGQRRRLALLVALLEDREVYVFDEWAADQDPNFKAYFYMEFIQFLKMKGKTVLLATHDDRYFSCADRIVNLEFGKIVMSHSIHSDIDSSLHTAKK
ncbi:hypothetical protein WT83_28920 [Burkholderia territorii]|uniref:Cyclic peptide export ABC transporter n=2 Tax=Burkholderia territorii TaxID=1503055 RepID=A0A108E6J5_9BURK|nr:hypothetical protein WT83_28920 [Burkholderia territorii]